MIVLSFESKDDDITPESNLCPISEKNMYPGKIWELSSTTDNQCTKRVIHRTCAHFFSKKWFTLFKTIWKMRARLLLTAKGYTFGQRMSSCIFEHHGNVSLRLKIPFDNKYKTCFENVVGKFFVWLIVSKTQKVVFRGKPWINILNIYVLMSPLVEFGEFVNYVSMA